MGQLIEVIEVGQVIEVIEVIEVIQGKVTMPRESKAVIDHRSDGAGLIPEMPYKRFYQ